MTYLVARIAHAAQSFIDAVTRAVVVKLSGFSDYEAGDHLQHVPADMLADVEAEYEVAEPYWGEPSRCPNAGRMCNCTGACLRPQTPVASAGRGESSSPGVSVTPTPPGERARCAYTTAERADEFVIRPRLHPDVTVIGPGCFAATDGSVINWCGVNYVPQK